MPGREIFENWKTSRGKLWRWETKRWRLTILRARMHRRPLRPSPPSRFRETGQAPVQVAERSLPGSLPARRTRNDSGAVGAYALEPQENRARVANQLQGAALQIEAAWSRRFRLQGWAMRRIRMRRTHRFRVAILLAGAGITQAAQQDKKDSQERNRRRLRAEYYGSRHGWQDLRPSLRQRIPHT